MWGRQLLLHQVVNNSRGQGDQETTHVIIKRIGYGAEIKVDLFSPCAFINSGPRVAGGPAGDNPEG